jgi:hypothetical protein
VASGSPGSIQAMARSGRLSSSGLVRERGRASRGTRHVPPADDSYFWDATLAGTEMNTSAARNVLVDPARSARGSSFCTCELSRGCKGSSISVVMRAAEAVTVTAAAGAAGAHPALWRGGVKERWGALPSRNECRR